MSKNIPYIKTKLLKKLKRCARKRYKFEEVYTRNEQKQSVPLYRVLDTIYDYDDCYRVQKETTNREEAWSFYISKYREIIFEKLDEYYKICDKTPKSIRIMRTAPQKPQVELNDDVSNKQMPNKIKI